MSKPAKTSAAKAPPKKPKLLTGGNPQIAKGYGDGPIEAYMTALPGWKEDVGRRLDKLIVEAIPKVSKAVKWNSPFYGNDGDGWFVSYHAMTRYIKIAFFRGTSLKPMPPVESKQANVRYLHINEDGALDDAQFTKWIKQASKLPGERL